MLIAPDERGPLALNGLRVGPVLGSAAEHAAVIRRGLEMAAPSVLNDERCRVARVGVLLGADRDDGPIAQGRHSE